MSWRLPLKLFFTVILVGVIGITGCSTSLCKKRGILFRGDWAFEVNRTPWVGCPADVDSETSEKDGKDKKGLLKSCSIFSKGKCHHGLVAQNCAQCYTDANGITGNAGNGNNDAASPLASLPPGSIVVSNGVVLPNGIFVPQNDLPRFQARQQTQQQIQQGIMPGTPGLNPPMNAQIPANGLNQPGNNSGNTQGTTSMYHPGQNGMVANGLPSQVPMMSSGMLINPIDNQVVPGLTMSGYASPGYPPIGYSPTGYSPGQAQPYELPTLVGNTGEQSATAFGTQNGAGTVSGNSAGQGNSSPEAQAAMPYPRFHPVPTHPAFQRSMGMAANNFQAVRAPVFMPPGFPGYPVYPGMQNMGMQQGMMPYPNPYANQYNPYMNPYANPYANPVLEQQKLVQAKLKSQANSTAKKGTETPNSHIMQASQQRLASTVPVKKKQ